MSKILALCGGVGGAKLAYGLARVLPPGHLTIIVNTGDDFEHLGLEICPDFDTVLYTLAEVENQAQGWGRANEGWAVLDELQSLGGPGWFRLGDKDIALHLRRLSLRKEGMRLTEIAGSLARSLGVAHRILPMSDQPVRTVVQSAEGDLAFQDYFVRRRCEPELRGLRFEGAARASLSPEVADAFADKDLKAVIICPSNPFVSIGPMFAVPGFREALRRVAAPVLAVSPIVAGAAIKGPAAKMMAELGMEASALGVARHYASVIDALLIDEQDRDALGIRTESDPRLLVAPTIMASREDRIVLARTCLELLARVHPASTRLGGSI